MKNIFTNNSIWKKIIIAVLIVFAFQIVAAIPVHAEGDNLEPIGVLGKPVASLLVSLGDGIMNLLHKVIMGQAETLPLVNGDELWMKALKIAGAVIVGLIAAAAIIALSVATLGAIDAVLAAVGTSIAVGSIGMGTVVLAAGAGLVAGTAMYTAMMPKQLSLPIYSYSAEEIFSGDIMLFNVNFFDEGKEIYLKTEKGTYSTKTNSEDDLAKKIEADGGAKYYFYYDDSGIKTEEHQIPTSPQDSATILHNTVARWYVAIRNICIVIMLSVLIYIGIRMMLTTVSNDKAKYREMLRDWVVGLCLLFVIHYIMAFSVVLVQKVTDVIKAGVDQNAHVVVIPDKYDGNLEKTAKELGIDTSKNIVDTKDDEGNDIKALVYPTNLMGKIRLQLQLTDATGEWLGLVVCFLILVIFTIFFTFTYLRRLLYMAFLTIIAPMVAMTYCIDKVNDGQAQGFNSWLKEYIFNLLLQPMHLLLYFILVSSAFELAGKNVIYSLVALGFMIPAEKLLRGLFGFEKAKTPPLLGGPAGTALMMQGLNKLTGAIGKGKKGAGEGASASASSEDTKSPKVANGRPGTFEALANNTSDNQPDAGRQAALPANNTDNTGDIDSDDQNQPRLFDNSEDESTYLNAQNAGNGQTQLFNPNDESIYQIEQTQGANQGLDAPENTEDTSIRMANTQAQGAMAEGENTDDNNNTDADQQERPRGFRGVALGSAAKGRRIRKSTTAAARVAIRNAPKKVRKKAFKAAKAAAVGIPLGAAGVGLGLAAGIASGDPSKAVTGAVSGAGLGYAAGSRAANSKASSHISEETKAAFDEIYHGEEYKEQDIAAESKKQRKDATNQIKAEQALKSKEKAKEFMKDGGNYDTMIKAGITDIDRALALEQGINERVYDNVEDAIAHSQIYDNFGGKDPEKMGAKDQQDFNKTIYQGLRERNVSENAATEKTNKVRKGVSFLHGKLH